MRQAGDGRHPVPWSTYRTNVGTILPRWWNRRNISFWIGRSAVECLNKSGRDVGALRCNTQTPCRFLEVCSADVIDRCVREPGNIFETEHPHTHTNPTRPSTNAFAESSTDGGSKFFGEKHFRWQVHIYPWCKIQVGPASDCVIPPPREFHRCFTKKNIADSLR